MKQKTKGSALILTTILLFVILGMVVSLTYVTVMEQKMSGKTKSSVTSFYNAESGIEWVLNKISSSSAANISSTFGSQWDNANSLVNCPASFGNNDCKIYLLDKDGNVIQNSSIALSEIKAVRSVGSQGNETQRAIEAAVATAPVCNNVVPTTLSGDMGPAVSIAQAAKTCRDKGGCWHLPTVEELAYFMDPADTSSDIFWTSTRSSFEGSGGTDVNRFFKLRLNDGLGSISLNNTEINKFRCVE